MALCREGGLSRNSFGSQAQLQTKNPRSCRFKSCPPHSTRRWRNGKRTLQLRARPRSRSSTSCNSQLQPFTPKSYRPSADGDAEVAGSNPVGPSMWARSSEVERRTIRLIGRLKRRRLRHVNQARNAGLVNRGDLKSPVAPFCTKGGLASHCRALRIKGARLYAHGRIGCATAFLKRGYPVRIRGGQRRSRTNATSRGKRWMTTFSRTARP